MTHEPPRNETPRASAAPAQPFPAAPAAVEELIDSAPTRAEPQASPSYIWFQVLGQFGVFVAFITPLAISLAIRLSELAPGRDEYLGYITGSGPSS